MGLRLFDIVTSLLLWLPPGIPNDGIPNYGIPNNGVPKMAIFGIPQFGIPGVSRGIPNSEVRDHIMIPPNALEQKAKMKK